MPREGDVVAARRDPAGGLALPAVNPPAGGSAAAQHCLSPLRDSASPPLDTFAEEWQDVVGFWVAAEHRLREEQFTVEMYVEDASRSRDDLDNVDCLLPLLENARNQTGRVGQRASGNAVLDPDMMLRPIGAS